MSRGFESHALRQRDAVRHRFMRLKVLSNERDCVGLWNYIICNGDALGALSRPQVA